MAPDRGGQGAISRDGGAHMAPRDAPSIADEAVPSDADLDAAGRGDGMDARQRAEALLAARAADPTNFTLRGILVGLAIGVVICFSNIYFGLQTGWISGMSMPSALISFAFFRAVSKYLRVPFSPVENVLVQSVAGSVGTMPLGCGFVGVIPALEYLLRPEEGGPLHLSLGQLCMWGVGICLFGVVFAVPLRRQVIIREKLKFPTGAATALMIGVLHGDDAKGTLIRQEDVPRGRDGGRHDAQQDPTGGDDGWRQHEASSAETMQGLSLDGEAGADSIDWRSKIKLMTFAFCGSACYTIFTYFIPQIRNIPIFGTELAGTWLWALNPSPAYVGQGIIMGPATTLHMLVGAIIGWGILSPVAKSKGWAPGAIDDWETGSKGWIVWVSLAIMFADAILSIGWLVLEPLIAYGRHYFPDLWSSARNGECKRVLHLLIPYPQHGYSALSTSADDAPAGAASPRSSYDGVNVRSSKVKEEAGEEPELDAPPEHLLTTRAFLFWLVVSIVLYFGSIHLTFPSIISFTSSFVALLLALLLSIMGVRAIGSTDLNPVSGISKLTQLFFSLFIPVSNPNAIIINLLAGGVSESGALQAGDLLQDLKTGHLLGASPKAQFYGQLIASGFGAVLAACVYRLYTNVYTIPDATFQIPTAFVWIFTARLVVGKGLPAKAAEAAAVAAGIFAVATVARTYAQRRGSAWLPYVPGGIAVAVGMYNTPSFTLARVIGGLISAYWGKWRGKSEEGVVVLASGLILGEGLFSIANLVMASFGVPHL